METNVGLNDTPPRLLARSSVITKAMVTTQALMKHGRKLTTHSAQNEQEKRKAQMQRERGRERC